MFKVQDLEVSKGSKKQGYLKIAEKPAGPHKVPLTVVNGAGDGPTLLVNGGIHGSEYNGPAACLQVLKELDPTKVSGKVIIVPIVNTLAFEGRSVHGNPVDHRDLSGLFVPDTIREIPKRGSGSPVISYQLAQIFYNECLAKADYRMDLHGGDIEEDLAVFSMYRKLGIDPEMDKAALKLARNFGWDWIRESLPRGPPPREPLKMPVSIGTEAAGMGRCQIDMVKKVVKGIYNSMKYLNMLEGEPDIPDEAKVFNTQHLYSTRGGFFISYVRAHDMITEGQKLGEIKTLEGETVEEFFAPKDGLVIMVTSPANWQGDVVFELGHSIRTIQ